MDTPARTKKAIIWTSLISCVVYGHSQPSEIPERGKTFNMHLEAICGAQPKHEPPQPLTPDGLSRVRLFAKQAQRGRLSNRMGKSPCDAVCSQVLSMYHHIADAQRGILVTVD